jgi:oligosaccharide repeat unit polymerase
LGGDFLSLFLVTWVLTDHFFARFRFFRPAFSAVSFETNPWRLTWMAIAFCAAGFVPYALSGHGTSEVISLIFQSRMAEKPWLHWQNLGDFRSPFLYISHSAMTAGACVLWLTTQEKKLSFSQRFLVGIIALIVSLVIFFDQGTRSTMALVLLPVFMVKFFEASKGSRVRFAISAFAFVMLFMALLQYQLVFRTGGILAGLPNFQLFKWVTLEDTTDMFSETVFSLKLVPALHDYFRESVLVQFLVSPIPRFIWPSKPASEVVWFYTLHRWGIDIYEGGGNIFPGMVGHSYMSWGGWGPIFLGGFMGWLSCRIDDFLVRTSGIQIRITVQRE